MGAYDIEAVMRLAFQEVGLIVSSPEAVFGVELPVTSKEFLLDVGLPAGRPFGFDFSYVQFLPTVLSLVTNTNSLISVRPSFQYLRCISDAYGMLMAVDPQEDGAVILIDLNGKLDDMFVNSKVEMLGACLAESVLFDPDSSLRSHPSRRAKQLSDRLLQIDGLAITHPRSWWETVLQEVASGLL